MAATDHNRGSRRNEAIPGIGMVRATALANACPEPTSILVMAAGAGDG